jgi:preprotein translocase subunit SecB
MTQNTENPEENVGAIAQSPVIIHHQFLKDMSFENPNAPGILVRADTPPEVDVDIAIDMRKLEHPEQKHCYEVILGINATAKRQDKTMFLAEIQYGASVFINENMDEKKHHPVLFIEVPRMIFPFARQILATATQAGGYTALNIAVVNFRAMYLQRFGKKPDETSDHADNLG